MASPSALSAAKYAAIGFGRSRVMAGPPGREKAGALAPSISGTPADTDRDNYSPDFSIEVEGRAHVAALQDAAGPVHLVGRLGEWVIAENSRVLSPADIVDFADRFAAHV